jgi:hypothetical protein
MVPHSFNEKNRIWPEEVEGSFQGSLQSPVARKQPRRSVDFEPLVQVRRIPNRRDYSRKEIASLWMSRNDYESFRIEIQETLEMVSLGMRMSMDDDVIDEEQRCLWGLQKFSDEEKAMRLDLRRRSRKAVFLEQEIQGLEGYFCEELVAMSCMEHSERARELAYKRGVQNARDIQENV